MQDAGATMRWIWAVARVLFLIWAWEMIILGPVFLVAGLKTLPPEVRNLTLFPVETDLDRVTHTLLALLMIATGVTYLWFAKRIKYSIATLMIGTAYVAILCSFRLEVAAILAIVCAHMAVLIAVLLDGSE